MQVEDRPVIGNKWAFLARFLPQRVNTSFSKSVKIERLGEGATSWRGSILTRLCSVHPRLGLQYVIRVKTVNLAVNI